MKKLITTLSIIVALFFVSPNPSNAQVGVIETDRLDLIIPNAITSSVSLVMIEAKGGLGTCTGVVIKNTPTESIILTAKHCIVFEGEIYVESFRVDEVGVSYRSDLAYLVLNKFIPYKTPARISNYIPEHNDQIAIVGYPGMNLYTSTGTIFLQTSIEQYAFIDIIKGCSGGGAFNTDGELIGIVVKHYRGIGITILERLEDIHTMINVNEVIAIR